MSQQSFNNSLPSLSQSMEFQIVHNPAARGRGVTLAQMRGVIPLFNHYFKQVDEFGVRKKMSRAEKQRRWVNYKQKIWEDYNRRITGTFASEQALVRRYSDPLTFLKYKLKRATNLIIADLSDEDQAYYREIGGVDDINEMIARTGNVDSVNTFHQPPARRQRLNDPVGREYDRLRMSQQQQSHNHNHNQNHNLNQHPPQVQNQSNNNRDRLSQAQVAQSNSAVNHFNVSDIVSPVALQPGAAIKENDEKPMDVAIDKLNDDLDVQDQELLLKKKIEAYEITQEKIRALMSYVKQTLAKKPEMIGSIPGLGCLEDQMNVCFDYWINAHKTAILSTVKDVNSFMEQILILKSDPKEFSMFLQKWKFIRMLKNDSFQAIWSWMKEELNIEIKSDKEEEDQEQKVDDDFDLV